MKKFFLLLIAVVTVGFILKVDDLLTTLPPTENSVLFVAVEVERPVNPFMMFFFGKFHRTVAKKTEISHQYGSAFIVEHHLLTARHVVLADDGEKVLCIKVTDLRGRESEVKVVSDDKRTDQAELTLPQFYVPSLKLATKVPRVGDAVTEVGHPALIPWVVSVGKIVGFDREQGYNIAVLDTYGGNSGGPIVNDRGEVVGMAHTLINGSRFTGIGTLADLTFFLHPYMTR